MLGKLYPDSTQTCACVFNSEKARSVDGNVRLKRVIKIGLLFGWMLTDIKTNNI